MKMVELFVKQFGMMKTGSVQTVKSMKIEKWIYWMWVIIGFAAILKSCGAF